MFCEIDKAGFGLMGTKWKVKGQSKESNLLGNCHDITVITCKNTFAIKLIENQNLFGKASKEACSSPHDLLIKTMI